MKSNSASIASINLTMSIEFRPASESWSSIPRGWVNEIATSSLLIFEQSVSPEVDALVQHACLPESWTALDGRSHEERANAQIGSVPSRAKSTRD